LADQSQSINKLSIKKSQMDLLGKAKKDLKAFLSLMPESKIVKKKSKQV